MLSNPDALAAYAKLSGPALQAAGGRILVRGLPAHTYEAGLAQRSVVIEFDSVAQAMAAHDSAARRLSPPWWAGPSTTSASSRRLRLDDEQPTRLLLRVSPTHGLILRCCRLRQPRRRAP
ncbi:DUF1330 domain-containing protein [Methylobacterium tarhaniae]|uniref:DUF1330 domain-containing protein n=1 Tax=Methylobacterium tarhaniae TaxID=1187852 RepID=UPI000A458BEB|nr:DUF1330 domain-containing protein [Methylobacterium tarhaniae]